MHFFLLCMADLRFITLSKSQKKIKEGRSKFSISRLYIVYFPIVPSFFFGLLKVGSYLF